MEIMKREILVSIAIVFLMLAFGLSIQQSIRTGITNENKEYETAVQTSDPEIFKYGMRTNLGNAFVYGELLAVDPVSNPDIDGVWLWIKKVVERYTMHSRIVTYTDGKGKTRTRTETYWTWDEVGSKTWHSSAIEFLGVQFSYDLITGINSYRLKTDTHGHTRYLWYVSPTKHVGTIYTELANNTISRSTFYDDMTTEETFNYLRKSDALWLVLFWIFWIGLTAAAVFGFYYLKNSWLE